jgi:hypothetical protein
MTTILSIQRHTVPEAMKKHSAVQRLLKTGPLAEADRVYFQGEDGKKPSRKKDVLSLIAGLLFLAGAGSMVVEEKMEDKPVPVSTWCWVGGCSLNAAISAMPFVRRRKKPGLKAD